jgi:hypothetical protein
MNIEPSFGDKANVAVLPKVQAFELDFLRQCLEKRAEALEWLAVDGLISFAVPEP